MRLGTLLTAATTAAALAVSTGAAAPSPATTLAETIVERDGDGLLDRGPGEPYALREELARARPGREGRRRSLVFFGQLTDFQLLDEESPARVELLDRYGAGFGAAYRPQEGLLPHVAEQAVRSLRGATSPLDGTPLELVMTTGDNVDNTQRNETRWLVELLDGGALLDPNSGRPGTCGSRRDGHLYDGVRGGGEYYDPDRSGKGTDGPGYAPRPTANRRAAGRPTVVRDFPGLFEEMNRPFRTTGLGVPWYGVFGNHDALVQGNVPRNPLFAQLAVGCLKVTRLSERARREIAPLLAGGLTREEQARLATVAAREIVETTLDPKRHKGLYALVPRDPSRALLTKSDYIREHFRTRGLPPGHGFTEDNVARGEGNYAFSPKPGLRFVVLDTTADSGDGGNLDDPQFRWLHEELAAAEAAGELVLVFGHHSLRTMSQAPAAGAPPVHYGLGAPGSAAPCLTEAADAAPGPDETLRCLLLRHPAVVAYVVGHEHRNRIAVHERPGGGFWEIVTAAHADWPQQSRLLQLFDNGDGTLSLFATIVDHAAPLRPPAGGAAGRRVLRPADVARLASIARELAHADPQAENGRDGRADRRGAATDRNVELLVLNPYR